MPLPVITSPQRNIEMGSVWLITLSTAYKISNALGDGEGKIIKVVEIALLMRRRELFRSGFMFVRHFRSYSNRGSRRVKCACFMRDILQIRFHWHTSAPEAKRLVQDLLPRPAGSRRGTLRRR